MNSLNELVERIGKLPSDWHKSGSVSKFVLKAILKHASNLKEILNTAETGSGRTTLLFSHLSKKHLVFSLDNYNTISVVKKSDLFKSENVTFIEGPTQQTLPRYYFSEKFDIVLLDGAHGYPFPEISYFYFYPRIVTGGLLLIDDIAIPSISRMFEILKSDEMWELLEVVDSMGFLRRTGAPLIDPYSDSWWQQGYNKPFAKKLERREKLRKYLPNSVRPILPDFIKKLFVIFI